MNKYKVFWSKGKKPIEVYASSSYEAQTKAVAELQKGTRKKVNGYDLSVVLCEIDSKQVVHSTSEL